MYRETVGSCRKHLFSIMIGIFCVLLLLPWFEQKEKRVNVEVRYIPDSEYHPELAWISDIYVNKHLTALDNVSGEIEYKEKDNQYRWDGFRDVTLSMEIGASDSLEFQMGYREGEEDEVPPDAEMQIRIGDQEYRMPLRTFFDQSRPFVYQGMRLKHWARCAILFLASAVLWYLLLTKVSANKDDSSKTNRWMQLIAKVNASPLFYVVIWAATVRMWLYRWSPAYIPGGDTPTYLIDSLGDLSWFHRMPVYQIFLLVIRKALRCGSEEMLFACTALIQIAVGIVACALMYLALRKILKREWLAFAGALIYAAQPFVLYYEYNILTESLAIDMMVGLIWLLASYLEKPSGKTAFGLGIYSLVLTLTRPSFLILFPVLAVFFFVKLFTEKEELRYTVWGIAGMGVSTLLLLLYCGNNQRLTGQFMLCDVSYNNQISILVENGLYENAEYPEITEIIRAYEPEGVDSLGMSDKIYEAFGYQHGVAYIKSTVREKAKAYFGAIYNKWQDYSNKPLWKYEYELGSYFETGFEGAAILLMPLNFLCITFLSVFEIIAGFFSWYRTQKVPWVRWGTAALILSVIILGFGTLTHAIPQRICVCVIPLSIVMLFGILERGIDLVTAEAEKERG